MLGLRLVAWSLAAVIPTVFAWPDGAPCVHAAFESMNPLEAVEHQGGLQLNVPPYEIAVDQKCYWRNQPIGLTLQGHNESVWFKGFVIQPMVWNNDVLGGRIGQLVRLDDNGSWQQQCFRYKDSATHSHDEKKKHIKMWWKIDDEVDTVQFVATVVKHQTMFWVKSVRSKPLPPCRLNRDGFSNYVAPLPSVPPTVKQFKMETFKVFDSIPLGQPLPIEPQSVRQPTFQTQPPVTTETPRMTKIIPLPDGFRQGTSAPAQSVSASGTASGSASGTASTSNTGSFEQQQQPRPIPPRPRQRIISQQPQPAFNNNVNNNNGGFSRRRFQGQGQGQQQNFRPTQQFTPQNQCIDRDPSGRCPTWRQFCRAPSHQRYLSSFCARTCGFCRR